MNNRKKQLIIWLVAGVSIGLVCIFAYTYYNRTKLVIKQEKWTFEYGQKIEINHETFLKLDENEKKKKEIIDNTQIESNFILEKDKDYPLAGEYEIIFKFNKTEEIVKISITDTVSPTITTPKSIEVLQGDNLDEKQLHKYFQSQDLSKSDLSFDITQYDKTKVGQQIIKVIAKDIHGNQTTQDFNIQTIEKPDANKYNIKTIVDKDKNGQVSNVYIQKTEKSFQLNVKLYCQHDVGARMGCDPAALYQAMKYKGYCQNVSLKSFIQDMPISKDDNPNNGFAGNPFGKNEPEILETIFPAPMANWAKKYGKVSNFSGHSVDDIIDELRKNNPVVVYVTYNFNAPKWRNWHFGSMYSNLHCFTASGYNPETKQIRLSDPGGARTHRWVSLSTFTRSYNYKKFAVVVR